MVEFEGKDRREATIEAALKEYGIASLDEAKAICDEKGINVDEIVKGIQPIAFENAVWAYTLGCAIALKKGITKAADAAARQERSGHFCARRAGHAGALRQVLFAAAGR